MDRSRQSGFTLVELMVATIAAAILALLFGAILVITTSGMTRLGVNSTDDTHGVVNLQRDAAVAFVAMNRVIRAASFTNLTFAANRVNVSSSNGVTRSFYQENANLVYDMGNGATVLLVNGRMKQNGFTCATNVSRTVTVRVRLAEKGDVLDAAQTILPRN